VDIDWEYWSGYTNNVIIPAESNALITLLRDLKKELDPFNLGISIDVGANEWAGKHFFKDVSNYTDNLQVMAYDFTGPWTSAGPHSSFEDAIGSGYNVYSTGLAYWVNYRGWPKDQVLLGVPFYGKDFNNQGNYVEYSKIIEHFPEAYLSDQVNDIYYNGIYTMTRKAKYVADNNYSGIMIWEITQDSRIDSLSLLNAIDKGIKK
jgi:GH18 family chitinase